MYIHIVSMYYCIDMILVCMAYGGVMIEKLPMILGQVYMLLLYIYMNTNDRKLSKSCINLIIDVLYSGKQCDIIDYMV